MKESAFPHQIHVEKREGGFSWTEIQEFAGMSLRDYFAAKALAGMLAQHPYRGSAETMFARDAYALADAMMKAKES